MASQAAPTSPTPGPLDSGSVFELTPSDSTSIPGPTGCPYDEIDAFLLAAELAFGNFPLEIRRRVLMFRDHGNLDGVLLLRGLPLDEHIPPTPLEPNRDARRQTYLAEHYMGAIAKALGEPVSYFQEKGGKLFQGLYPLRDEAYKQTNGSSATFLKFHTEVAFHPHMLSHVILCGLRQDRERAARTVFSSIRRILPHLTLAHRRELFIPQFKTKVDASFGGGEGPTLAVLSGDPGDPFLRFDDDFMTAETAAGDRALAALRAAVNQERREIAVGRADMLIIDNHRAVHARSEFLPHYDGEDRYLLRLGVVRDLSVSLEDRLPGTRIIASDNFMDI
ncbi:MAG: TauD/TfdA family dioxygenase [Acidobacteriota bacterium]